MRKGERKTIKYCDNCGKLLLSRQKRFCSKRCEGLGRRGVSIGHYDIDRVKAVSDAKYNKRIKNILSKNIFDMERLEYIIRLEYVKAPIKILRLLGLIPSDETGVRYVNGSTKKITEVSVLIKDLKCCIKYLKLEELYQSTPTYKECIQDLTPEQFLELIDCIKTVKDYYSYMEFILENNYSSCLLRLDIIQFIVLKRNLITDVLDTNLNKNKRSYGTLPERKVAKLLDELGVTYSAQVIFKTDILVGNQYQDICQHKRAIPDFVVYKNNAILIIEVNGDFWHGNPKIYNINQLSPKQLQKQASDNLKYDWYHRQGYKLLVLWEYDVNHNLTSVKKQLENFIQ